MATIEQTPPGRNVEIDISPLNSLLARAYTLNWEAIYYVTLFAAAVLTRFVNLGDRVMSHDESLHTTYSYNLYKKGDFAHTPLMHGPVLFHMTALMYFFFGDNDFSARLYPAILGVILVFFPKLLFERWLGRRGAMVSSLLLLISPMILFHNRYIREDTPSIFFTLLMVYAIFAYIDGVRPRQTRHLILLSAAMLLSLASKEVAFMYIAIFGSVLTLYWLFQVMQGARAGLIRPVSGRVVGGVVGLLIVGAVSLSLSGVLGKALFPNGSPGSGLLLAVPIALALLILAIVLLRPLRETLGAISLRGNSTFKVILAGIIIGVIAALAMTCILSIVQPKPDTPVDAAGMNRLIIWVTLLGLVLALAVIVPALIRFARSPRLPWLDIGLLVLVAIVTCAVLVFLEERSRAIGTVAGERTRQDLWILATWVIGIAAVAGILVLRFLTSFFQDMKRYPVFDVLIVMGTLVLPWLAAFPLFLAGYKLDESNVSIELVRAGILVMLPIAAISISAGLCWNASAWLACAATFYAIFAFFFTTIFTNINGIVTGLIGSLGYWLEQQGVRRGSQPQYYYLLVELPVYEYLPVIGAIFAGIAGMFGLWRFRAQRMAEVEAAAIASEMLVQSEAAGFGADTPVPADADQAPPAQEIQEIREKRKHDFSQEHDGEMVSQPPPTSADATMVNAMRQTQPFERVGAEDVALETLTETGPTEEERRRIIPEAEWVDRMPFLGFVGYWAVLLIMAFTMAGEKMPWLTTHLTVPLIFITGWYIGMVLDTFDWQSFWQRGWAIILLSPVLVLALANVAGPFVIGVAPFSGIEREELLRTFTWLGAVLLAGLVGYAVYRVWKQVGTSQSLRIGLAGFFVLLAVLTTRTAFMAAYINYDYATEFMVYAHGAPANKIVMNVIEDISRRTTDGLNIKVAYDNEVSWPGSWYFRNYPPGSFKGDMTGVTDLDQNVAVVVGDGNNSKVQSQLADKFYEVKYARLWWPMQDYFDLNVSRIDNVFAGDADLPEGWVRGSALREDLWDIWWNRDYTAYGKAVNKDFSVSKWPVTDWMHFYVRKDVAAQIWDMGTGAAKVAGLPEDPFKTLKCDTCQANSVMSGTGDAPGLLNHPRGLAVGPDGNLYVADSQNARISVFDFDGHFLRQFGQAGSVDQGAAPGGTFREPWGVAVGQDGTIYVADTWNHRIQVFDKDGHFLRMWGQFEQVAPGQSGKPDGFWGPRDIAVDAQNHVYVADTGNKRIRVYDAQGAFLYNIGQGGARLGDLNEPVGLAIDPQTSEIFVADTWNKRINVYNLNGTYRRSWTLQAWGATTETGSRPFLALDKTYSYLFVTDPDAGRVLVFDTNGVPLTSFGSLGTAPNYSANQFGKLGGITVDNAGRLVLADADTGRLLRFSLESIPALAAPVPANPNESNQNGAPEQPGTPATTQEVF